MKKIAIFIILSLIEIISYSQTNVGGGIYSNTTWTLSNSPYIVTSNLTLFPNFTLTIEPGVVIKFNDNTSFNVRGSLIAIGSSTNFITFTSSSTSPSKGIWGGVSISELSGTNATINFCKFSYALPAIYIGQVNPNPIIIKNSEFTQNASAFSGYASGVFKIDSCKFTKNQSAIGGYSSGTEGNLELNNSLFTENDYALNNTNEVTANSCIFTCNKIAAYVWSGTFDNCKIESNQVGVKPANKYSITITNSSISNNDTGIILNYFSAGNNIHQNNICNNKIFNIVHSGNYNENLDNNCWCDTNKTILSQKIYDGYDNISLGLITINPLKTCTTNSGNILTCSNISNIISNKQSDKNITLFPNPMQSFTIIKSYDYFRNVDVLISNITGKKEMYLENQSGSEIIINRNNLKSGIYIVSLISKEEPIKILKLLVSE